MFKLIELLRSNLLEWIRTGPGLAQTANPFNLYFEYAAGTCFFDPDILN